MLCFKIRFVGMKVHVHSCCLGHRTINLDSGQKSFEKLVFDPRYAMLTLLKLAEKCINGAIALFDSVISYSIIARVKVHSVYEKTTRHRLRYFE